MISVICSTNLDGYKKEVWPTQVAQPVRISDRIRSESGKELRVLGICHGTRKMTLGNRDCTEPVLYLDLNKIL